jgi:O-antigen/teichoic acid export membrane protein
MFFVIQIAALFLFQTDNLIIAHYLGAAAVTPYSVTWRLFTYTMIFQMLAAPSYWPAYAEAFSRGDRAWVRRSFRVNFRVTVASTLLLALPLVVFGKWIIEKWAGPAAAPPSGLLIWMGIWSVIYAATCSQSLILASSSRLRGQMIYSISAAAVNIALSVIFVKKIGITGAVLGTVAAYVLCILVPQWIEVERAIQDPHSDSPRNPDRGLRESAF